MSTRTRTRDSRYYVNGAYFHWLNSPQWQDRQALVGETERCEDVEGDHVTANALKITKTETDRFRLNGRNFTSRLIAEFLGPPTWSYVATPPVPTGDCAPLSSGTQSNLAWEILAATNPNVAHINVPNAVRELKDLPELVHDWGGNLLRRASKGYLSWRWIVRPMLSDLGKLMSFRDAAERRYRELQNWRVKGKVLKKRCSLGRGEEDLGVETIRIHSDGAQIYADQSKSQQYKMWGSAQWMLSPDAVLPEPGSTSNDLDKDWLRAIRDTAGINSYGALATLWEATPWSWFVDWFIGVGTILDATNNQIPLTWKNLCVMRTVTTLAIDTFRGDLSTSWASVSGRSFARQTIKERYVVTPWLPFQLPSLPLFSQGQLSILSSLAALQGESFGRRRPRTRRRSPITW